jgi:hypothetical protein
LSRFDPIAPLVESGDPAIRYWARREFLGERVGPVHGLWADSRALALFRRQRPDGSWRFPGIRSQVRSNAGYDLLETYRIVRQLVEKFGADREHPGLHAAAEFLLAAQGPEGDIRGLYGAQYSPNYTAGILELLVKAGYAPDVRVDRGFAWLREARQEDGGWAIPFEPEA